MAGRGRGLIRRPDEKCEPLRRPGTKSVSKENGGEADIEERLQKLNLANYLDLKSPPSLAVLSQNVKDEVSSQQDMKAVAKAVVHFGIKGRQQASIAAQLVQDLRRFAYEDSKFLIEFLNILQAYFQAEDFSDKPTFLAYLTLLCETYHQFSREGSNPVSFLKSIILGFLQRLLEGRSDQEISTFVEMVLKLCYELTEKEWNDVMINVRKCIVSSKTTEKSRSSLLQIFELHLREWKALSKDINEVYNSYK